MPVLLGVPAIVLVVVAAATWRLERRLSADVGALAESTGRLASLRAALAALDDQVDHTGERHDALARS